MHKGPLIKDKQNAKAFKKKHKKTLVKGKRLYAEDDSEKNLKKFIEKWVKDNKDKIQDMSIEEINNI
jgi:predicted outer membrane protein